MKDMRFRYGLATLVLLAILAVLVVYAMESSRRTPLSRSHP